MWTWAYLDDGDDEIFVLEGEQLELILLDSVVWLWRDEEGRLLRVVVAAEC